MLGVRLIPARSLMIEAALLFAHLGETTLRHRDRRPCPWYFGNGVLGEDRFDIFGVEAEMTAERP
jgi:hypothetical protein